MKITLERLREIITEEVIKEELAPEIAAPAIAAMLQGMEPDATSDVFGDAFNQMYGEGALDAEAERQASAEEPKPEMRQPIGFDREPEEASMREPARMGFRENINEMIQEEYYIYMIESYLRNDLLTEAAESFTWPKAGFKRDRISPKEKNELILKSQDVGERHILSRAMNYIYETNPDKLAVAYEEEKVYPGLIKLIYQLSNKGRQHHYDQRRSIAIVEPKRLKQADANQEDQYTPPPRKEVPPLQRPSISPAKYPAAQTTSQVKRIADLWKRYIEDFKPTPDEFRAELEKTRDKLEGNKTIIDVLEELWKMLRNRSGHDFQTA